MYRGAADIFHASLEVGFYCRVCAQRASCCSLAGRGRIVLDSLDMDPAGKSLLVTTGRPT